jgi:quinol monooxygenase YgiN
MLMVVDWAQLSRKQRVKARNAPGVCMTVRAEAKPGREQEFEFLLSDMALQVRDHENGCTSYSVTHQLGSPLHFAVHARFADWTAFNLHAETAHMELLLPRLSPLLASPVSLEIFLEV